MFFKQIEMAGCREEALSLGVVALLDIGSSKMSCIVVRVISAHNDSDENSNEGRELSIRVIGAATTLSRGVKFGKIVDLIKAENSVRTVLSAATKMAQIEVFHVITCVSGGRPSSYFLEGFSEVADNFVDSIDIRNALNSIDFPVTGSRREFLHAHIQKFWLDRKPLNENPIGLTGEVLSVNVSLIEVDRGVFDLTSRVINQCGMKLAGISSSVYASANSVLRQEEKKRGAVCINLGGDTSSFAIVKDSRLVLSDSIELGGNSVTEDISLGLGISRMLADRIKTVDLVVDGPDVNWSRKISIPEEESSALESSPKRETFSIEVLKGIAQPRIEEILEGLREKIRYAGVRQLGIQNYVLTGGASQTPGLVEFSRNFFDGNVRLGSPRRINGLPLAASGPSFASVVGLSRSLTEQSLDWWDFDPLDHKVERRSKSPAHEDATPTSYQGLDEAIKLTPNGEIIDLNPVTQLLEALPHSGLQSGFMDDLVSRYSDAIEILATTNGLDNQYRSLSEEINLLRQGLEKYSDRPLRLHDICLQVFRRIEKKENNGECPDSARDVRVSDLKNELLSLASDIRGFDPIVKEVILSRSANRLSKLSDECLAILPDVADQLASVVNESLAEELHDDAKIALEAIGEKKANAIYRFASRLFRIFSIAYKAMRYGLKEGAAIWKDAAIAIAASPTILAAIQYFLSLF